MWLGQVRTYDDGLIWRPFHQDEKSTWDKEPIGLSAAENLPSVS